MIPPVAAWRRAPAAIALFLLLNAAVAGDRPPGSQLLNNEDIVRLVINGTDERVILEEIAVRPVDFDLEEDVVVELRRAGVNDRIIEAMRVRQRDMGGLRDGDAASPPPSDRARPPGFVLVALQGGHGEDDKEGATPFAVKALPRSVESLPGVEIGKVSELALAVMCRTSDHVPDHWDIHTPLEDAPRHRMLFFQAASRPDKVKKFEILRLDLAATPPVEVAAGRHALIVGLAGRSAGSGTWQLLASDSTTVDVRPGETVRLDLTATSELRGNRMAGYSVEQEWTIAAAPGGNPE